LSVCLSVSHISKTTPSNFTKFLFLLPSAVIRSSSADTAIRYALPVLWMTSFFSRNWPYGASYVFLCGERITASIPTKFCPTITTSKRLSWVACRGRSLLSTISLLLAVKCARAQSPTNGHVHGADYTYGAVVTFSCLKGFHLEGSHLANVYTCIDYLDWVGWIRSPGRLDVQEV